MKKILMILLAMFIFVSSFAGHLIPVEASNEKTVIALDPGHDAKHAGATAGGLLEHELTLKIAYYCKTELEKYNDIEVYMTRTDAACPYPHVGKSARCIEQRMLAAEAVGADYYVSIHLNAQQKGTTARGVEVFYPNSNWKPEVGNNGKILAEYIQSELVALGLNDRGIYSKNSSINEKYPDGSLADYYTVQIAGKYSSIPSVIVEHAFMTNESDRTNFLQSEYGLQKLGIADAKAIAKMLGKHVGWEYTNGNWYYYSGGILQTGWEYIDGYWYALDDVSGAMKEGWQYINNTWYYLQPGSGVMRTGWLQLGDLWYYLSESGAMVTGWNIINGTKYLFDGSGRMLEGAQSFIIDVSHWQGTIDWGKVAMTDVDGVIVRCGHGDSATETNGQWQDKKFQENINALNQLGIPYGIYHYNTATTVEQAKIQAQNAVAQIKSANASPTFPVYVDIEQDGGTCDLVEIAKVYMDEFVTNGYKAGIYANENYWNNYLKDTSLDLYYKWIAAYGENNGYAIPTFVPESGFDKYVMWQYTSNGRVAGITENTVDCNVMFQWHDKPNGWEFVDGMWFYYDNGYLAKDWKMVNGIWYYFSDSGRMQTGWQLVNNTWYYMSASGAMQTGWELINGVWYYMDASGAMQTGWQLINGTWYYLDTSGAMQTGWQLINNTWYYMAAGGAMQTGWQLINNTWYYMDASGAMQTGWQLINGTWYYLAASGAMQTGWQLINNTWYYMAASGAWIG